MMYNPQLDTFICVVETGSSNKAADRLFISSPAVIKQINSLEFGLGIQLFSRTQRACIDGSRKILWLCKGAGVTMAIC